MECFIVKNNKMNEQDIMVGNNVWICCHDLKPIFKKNPDKPYETILNPGVNFLDIKTEYNIKDEVHDEYLRSLNESVDIIVNRRMSKEEARILARNSSIQHSDHYNSKYDWTEVNITNIHNELCTFENVYDDICDRYMTFSRMKWDLFYKNENNNFIRIIDHNYVYDNNGNILNEA